MLGLKPQACLSKFITTRQIKVVKLTFPGGTVYDEQYLLHAQPNIRQRKDVQVDDKPWRDPLTAKIHLMNSAFPHSINSL